MEISSSHHHQEFCQPMPNQAALEEVLGGCHQTQEQHQEQHLERKPGPQQEQALNCPRCNSTNTKFCYYNNYSLSQPRYFCKGCRRYWTQGGTLRNVPVGGGCRKNHKRSSSLSSKKPPQDQAVTTTSNNPSPHLPLMMLPPLSYDSSDLALAFARLHKQPITSFRQLGLDGHHEPFFLGNHNPNSNPNSTHMPIAPTGFLDIFKSRFLDSTTTTTTTVTNHGFHSLYHGFGGGGSMEEELEGVGLQFDGSLGGQTSVGGHGSSCKAMDEGENMVLMGLQWQMDGDGSMGVDSSRGYYSSGVAASNWHGLINSSLM